MISSELITIRIREVHSVNVISASCVTFSCSYFHIIKNRFRRKNKERSTMVVKLLLHTLNLSFPVVVVCPVRICWRARDPFPYDTRMLIASSIRKHNNLGSSTNICRAHKRILFNFFQHLIFPCFGTCEIFLSHLLPKFSPHCMHDSSGKCRTYLRLKLIFHH